MIHYSQEYMQLPSIHTKSGQYNTSSFYHHVARFTTGNYQSTNLGCVTNIVTKLGWNLLEHRRAKHRIINNLANIPVHHQLKVHDSSTHGSASHKYRQLGRKLNCYKYTFLPATIVSSLYHHLCIDDLGFSLISYYVYIENLLI